MLFCGDGLGGHSYRLAEEDSSLHPWKAKKARGPKSWPLAPGPGVSRVLPRPDSQPWRAGHFSATGRSCPGHGGGVGGLWGSRWGWSTLLLPVVFLARTQASLRATAGKVPTLSSGPSSTTVPQGPCPTRGCMGLSLAPAILDGLTPTSAA